ncbi:MAG: M28 family metallopeptidase [Candidatus Hadarchaeum sp.]|nr:M28 family metallopeptidase [Candidatus Hadarchaeum sp.]
MRFNLRRFLILLALAALVCSSALVNASADSIADRAYGHVENITSVGPRFAGTAAEAMAASYIENEFRSYGLEVWVENFTIQNSYMIEENLLRVTSPEQFDIDFVPILYSPSADNVTGKLAHVVELPANYDQLQNQFVLIGRDNLEEFIGGLTGAPPLAVLTYYENWPPYSEMWTAELNFPVLWISWEDAQHLIELLAQGDVEVELSFKVSIESSTSQNVAALLRGQSDEIIVVGAHHDSMLTPGAVDDASGVAAVLEIAHTLSTENLSRTILFTSFGGEELGLLGSADFARRHVENKIVAVIIFDAIAPGPENGLRIGLEGPREYETTGWLDAYALELAENMGFYAKSEDVSTIGGYSDYASFTGLDVPGTWIYWVNPEHDEAIWPTHTLSDNLDAVNKTRLGQTVTFGAELVRRLAAEDLEALQWKYGFSMRAAFFIVIVLGVAAITMGVSCFLYYRRGWQPTHAVSIAIAAVSMSIIIDGVLLLV